MVITILFVLLGLIVGSFLNVVSLRLNTGLTLGGRSKCLSCLRVLRPFELIPLLSFFALKGRCLSCKSKISWQYPLVELFTATVFATTYTAVGLNLSLVFVLMIFSIYLVIFTYDIKHKIIPNRLVYLTVVLSLAYRLSISGFLGDWLAGPIIFIFFGLVWLITRGKAMGLGDAKLGLSIGLLLGLAEGLSAIVLAFWTGTIFYLIYAFLMRFSPLFKEEKRLTMKSEIPFAPFMILGAWLALVFGLDLLYVNYF